MNERICHLLSSGLLALALSGALTVGNAGEDLNDATVRKGDTMSADTAKDSAYLAELQSGLPAKGRTVLGSPFDPAQLTLNVASEELASMEVVDADGAPFARAVRVQVNRRTENIWDAHLESSRNEVDLSKGDMVLIAFQARCIVAEDESGEGMINVHLQTADGPWEELVGGQRRIGKAWKPIYIHAAAKRDWTAGTAKISLHVSPFVQTVEIGGLVVLNLGEGIDSGQMPVNRSSYGGREPDAAWRAEAAARIEKYRKGDLVVTVVDGEGNPVAGVPVRAEMKRHAYGFGSVFDSQILDETGAVGDDPDIQAYTDWFLKLYSKATTMLYWADWGWVNPKSRQRYHQSAKWLQDHGFPSRGHVLIWPSWRWLPESMKELENEPDELRRTAREHITEVVEAMRTYDLVEYDVMNEPRVNHDLMDILGDEVMLEWWRAAEAADGRQALYINEYSLLTGAGHTESEQAQYEKTIRYLLDNGAPLGGIGMQGHMSEGMTPPPRVYEIIDRFAAFGLPIQITEFDVEIDDEEAQADYLRDFYTIVFSHPATDSLIQWGFWEGKHWKPRAAMFRKDWTVKPNGQAYLDLVLGEWWSDEQGVTDEDGRFAIRGFCGEYTITIGDSAMSSTCTLSTDGESVRMVQP